MVQMVSSWSKNAKQGPERAMAAREAAAARDAAALAGDKRYRTHHMKAAARMDKLFDVYGIDLRNQEKDHNGRRIWTGDLRRQVVRAAFSGHWTKFEVTQAVGVYGPQLRQWALDYPEETIPGNGEPSSTPLESAIDKATSLPVASTSSITDSLTHTSTNDITPSLLNDESPTVSNDKDKARKSNKEVLKIYGVDLEGLVENHRGRVFPPELQIQIIGLLDSGRYTTNYVLGHMGISYGMVSGWRSKLAIARGGKYVADEEDDDDDDQDSAPSAIRSMAPQLAAGQVLKRAKRVANYKNSQQISGETIKVEASSIDHAIRLLELMRNNQEIAKVSMAISVVE